MIKGAATCPVPTITYKKSCCCFVGCCWSDCLGNTLESDPPNDCIQGVPNGEWVYNEKLKKSQLMNMDEKQGMYY